MVTMTQGYMHPIICGALEREKKICPWKSSGYTTGVHPFLSQKHSTPNVATSNIVREFCVTQSSSPFPFLQLQYLQAWMLPYYNYMCVESNSEGTISHSTYFGVLDPLPLPEKQHSVLLLCTFKKHTYSWCCTLQSANYTLPANHSQWYKLIISSVNPQLQPE